jgi:uncharacterized protein (TIGR02099 family)
LVLWLRYAALPNVDRFRAEIVASIEKSSGMSVSVGSIQGGWGGLRPAISLEGLAIADRAGRAAFQLQRAEATLSWWSLFGGQVRFHDVDFYRPHVELRRGADGLIYLADKPINATGRGGDGAFTEWLLAQPRLGIHDATLSWRDDFLGAPEVRLTGVEIFVRHKLGRHRAVLSAVPPTALARRIELRADVALTRAGDQWRAAGTAYAESLDADLGRLRDVLPVPETLRSGVGSARLWIAFTTQGVTEIVADARLRDGRAQLAADALPLELASLSGRATYRATPSGFAFATQGLRFRLPFGDEAVPGNFSLTRTGEGGGPARLELRADGIDLKIAAALVDYFPLPRDVKGHLQRFAPRGRIAEAVVAWSDDGAKAYQVRGRFEGLAVNAVDALPGVSGLAGSIEGTEAGGTVRIASQGVVLDLARMFRAPLAFDALEVDATWKRGADGLEVQVGGARFANADVEGSLAGTWRAVPAAADRQSPGYVDFKGTLARGVVARAAHYLPNRMTGTRDWVERAVQGGELTGARFEIAGDLWEFPFGAESRGRYVFEAEVRDAVLKYHPAWPSVDAIEAKVRFENRRLEVRAARATILASRVRSASAVVEDLRGSPPLLVIDGEVDTTGGDSARFLRESPLASGPGAFTRVVSVEGPTRLKLHLDFPLGVPSGIRVAGDYAFAGATATVARDLALSNLRGRLAFTESGVRATGISGTLFGEPAALSMVTEPDGRVLATIDGRIDAATLSRYLPEPIAARASGAFAWRARVLTGSQGTDLSLASDLKGLAVSLPEPLAKAADDARPLAIEISRLGGDAESIRASLGGGVHGRFARPAAAEGHWRALLAMGEAPGGEPLREGLWLQGRADFLDVDAWQHVFARQGAASAPQAARAAIELRGIDMRMGRARYAGRQFRDIAAKLERSDALWVGSLDGALVAGEVRWDPRGRGRLEAKLSRLSIPEQTPQPGVAAETPATPQDPPDLDVVAERFDFRGRALGRLDVKAQHVDGEWRIERMNIATAHASFASSGSWRRAGGASLTTLAIKVDAADLNALLAQFGYGEYLKRGNGKLEGRLAWPGYPHEFSTSILSGEFSVEAQRGQFAKLEPGAGKLLGLLSLQSLPRRALFDFRDVFSDGFAFDTVEGHVKVARGLLRTEDFEISGPSAFVSLAGEVSLPHETQSLTLRVVPEVGEGMALAATVFGTPVLGLSTLLVSKLLRNPLGKAVAYEYLVTGSWDNPTVTRTSAPPAKAAASTAAGAQK